MGYNIMEYKDALFILGMPPHHSFVINNRTGGVGLSLQVRLRTCLRASGFPLYPSCKYTLQIDKDSSESSPTKSNRGKRQN